MRAVVPLNPNISARISVLRFVMIAGIVVLHVPPYVPLTETADGVFPFIKAFFSGALFRATVPVLTCISGFLLFRAGLDEHVQKLVAKKMRNLLLPLVVWNVPLVMMLYVAQANGYLLGLSAQVYPFEPLAILDKSFGLITGPVNYPLGFLRDLFVLTLLSPVIGLLLRNIPWVGLVAILTGFLLNLDGPLLLRDTMPVNFYIGGMAAVLAWDLTRLDRYAPAFSSLLLAVCVVMVVFEIEDRRLFSLLSPVVIWPISALFVGTWLGERCQRLAPASFFIFLAHAPVLLTVWFAYQRFALVPYELFWFGAPVITMAICLVSRDLLSRLALRQLFKA
jgi:succinoglycan biosynthesis protein ExoH